MGWHGNPESTVLVRVVLEVPAHADMEDTLNENRSHTHKLPNLCPQKCVSLRPTKMTRNPRARQSIKPWPLSCPVTAHLSESPARSQAGGAWSPQAERVGPGTCHAPNVRLR